jgi:hypothetical protein
MARKISWVDLVSDDSDCELLEVREIKKPKTDAISPLCAQCQQLDLDKSFKEAAEFYSASREGRIVRRKRVFGDKTKTSPMYFRDAFLVYRFQDRLTQWSDCPLCDIFQRMRVQPSSHRHKLLAFCSSENSLFALSILKQTDVWETVQHTVFMAVVPDLEAIPPDGHQEDWLEKEIPAVGWIHLLHPDGTYNSKTLLLARELGETVDFSLLREWHSDCKENHGEACKPLRQFPPITRAFKLINCFADPPVVELQTWGVPYVALSYVWGKDPQEWPKTVLDAVTTTKEMGFQYLWVDRLCIDQKNEEKKQYLIERMTTIYAEAEFTIVAAAGSGADYGLPGVASTRRPPQPKFRLGSGNLLVATPPDPRGEILGSEYCTRGWTYQEGILSNRHLVVTDHQAYWECRCMAAQESVHTPLFHEATEYGARMADFNLGGIFKADYSEGASMDDNDRLQYGFPLREERTLEARLRGLGEHIRAFSARRLTNGEDSLRAFLGIAGLYRSDERLHLVLGLPIWTAEILGGRSGAQITFALSVSAWYHRSGGSHQMFVIESCPRRSHLPSWTWAGWKGTVTWRAPPRDEHCAHMRDLVELDDIDLVYAADITLRDAGGSVALRLVDSTLMSMASSAETLRGEALTSLEVKNPFLLKYSILRPVDDGKKKWEWRRLAGRATGEKHQANTFEWDAKWHRLAGRLVMVNLSVSMTMEQWTQKHHSKELISVLMIASRFPSNERHGRALFLTLRKAVSQNSTQYWERIGTVQLILSSYELDNYRSMQDMMKRTPVYQQIETIVIR